MAKNTKILIFLLSLALILFATNHWLRPVRQNQPGQITQAQPILAKRKVDLGGQKLEIEVAKSVLELAVGLSFRDQLGSDGMLFILPERQRAGFWMKDMKFDIDIIWIKDGKITQISPEISVNSYAQGKKIYYPDQAVDWVLELEAGRAVELNLEPGLAVILE